VNRNIPNILSVARIILSLSLFFIPVMSVPFQVIYVLAFVTDMVDGNLARATGTTSELGAKLDSYADAVYLAAALLLVFPWMEPSVLLIVCAVIVLVLKAMSFLWTRIKTGEFHTFHNILSKIGFFCLMVVPFAFMYVGEAALWAELALMFASVILDWYRVYDYVYKRGENGPSDPE